MYRVRLVGLVKGTVDKKMRTTSLGFRIKGLGSGDLVVEVRMSIIRVAIWLIIGGVSIPTKVPPAQVMFGPGLAQEP